MVSTGDTVDKFTFALLAYRKHRRFQSYCVLSLDDLKCFPFKFGSRSTLFVLIFARTNFCAFFFRYCAKISPYITRSGCCMKIHLRKAVLRVNLSFNSSQNKAFWSTCAKINTREKNQTQVREIKYA